MPRPTPSVFDFATLATPNETAEDTDDERFATNDWFTEDDLQHPERYFELAEQMPELNRPEERRDTLEFFLAYQDKLRRDLEAARGNPDRRREILAAIARYESASARLRALLDGAGTK